MYKAIVLSLPRRKEEVRVRFTQDDIETVVPYSEIESDGDSAGEVCVCVCGCVWVGGWVRFVAWIFCTYKSPRVYPHKSRFGWRGVCLCVCVCVWVCGWVSG